MSMEFSDSKCSDEVHFRSHIETVATASLNWDHTEHGLKLAGVTTMTTLQHATEQNWVIPRSLTT